MEIFTCIPLLVLICKDLANGLPARLRSDGLVMYGFLLLLFLIYRFCFFHS